MESDDEDMIGWEDGNAEGDDDDRDMAGTRELQQDDDDDDEDHVDWEEGGDEGVLAERLEGEGQDWEIEDGEEEPEERRWLGENGEIVVELPGEEGEDIADGVDGADGEASADAARRKGKGKEKSKPHRFTAEEIRQALNIHTVHLACLVSRCSLVSRWAGDPTVQAAMMSCLPAELVPERPAVQKLRINSSGTSTATNSNASEAGEGVAAEAAMEMGQQQSANSPNHEHQHYPQLPLSLAALVIWFRDFISVVDDGAVGSSGGGGSSWGSRPARLLKVIDQRVGCAQEAVQLFVALCRGLGLHARYVACLDPLPPHPRPPGPAKQTRANTVDLATTESGRQRRQRRWPHPGAREQGGWGATGIGRSALPVRFSSSRAWAEVLCWKGENLHVVTKSTDTTTTTTADDAQSTRVRKTLPRSLKRQRAGVGANPHAADEDRVDAGGEGSRATPLLLNGSSSGSDKEIASRPPPRKKKEKVIVRGQNTTAATAAALMEGSDGGRGHSSMVNRTRATVAAAEARTTRARDGTDTGEKSGGRTTAGMRRKRLSTASSESRSTETAMQATASAENTGGNKKRRPHKKAAEIAQQPSTDAGEIEKMNGKATVAAVAAATLDKNRMEAGQDSRRTSSRLASSGRGKTIVDERGRGGSSDGVGSGGELKQRETANAHATSNRNTRSSRRHAAAGDQVKPTRLPASSTISTTVTTHERPTASPTKDPETSNPCTTSMTANLKAPTAPGRGKAAGAVSSGCGAVSGEGAVLKPRQGVKVEGGGAAGVSAVTSAAAPGDGRRGSDGGAGGGERWVHVDPVQGAVDQAHKVQAMRFRKRLMPYVVALDGNRRIVDVTRRYSLEWSRTLNARGRAMAKTNGWWNQALRKWGTSADVMAEGKREAGTCSERALSSKTVGSARRVETASHGASEEKELQDKVNNEPLPNTIAALKNHHVYMLAKNLQKFEGIRPGAKAAGLVKGCKVYLKADVAKLRGASRWKQDSLQVKASELDKPAKVITKKGEKDGEGTGKLYGEWQTESWVPEAAVNGKVPKNEYGNVEFFDCSPAFLPPGTAHVRGDQIGRVAARLGVDYAPALTGFETKQGRQVPVMDGIIVCKEHAQMIQDAHTTWEQTNLEKQAKARERRVLRRWHILCRGVLIGANLLEEYGDHD